MRGSTIAEENQCIKNSQYLWALFGYTVLLLVMTPVEAQELDNPDNKGSQWRLGVMGTWSDDGYVEADNSASVYPLVYFDSRWLFFHATQGGIHLYQDDQFTLDAVVSIGGHEMDPDDLGREALAARGVDRDRLKDRDRSYYAGLAGAWKGRFGVLSAEARTDISGNAEGETYHVAYAYPWHVGQARVTPHIDATYLSDNVADYYFGLDADESLSGSYAYFPDAALVPGVGVDLAYSLSGNWTLYTGVDYQRYPDEIADSPLIEDDHTVSWTGGISYSF